MGNTPNRTRKNRQRRQCVCVMCGTPFLAARTDATTDTNLCRSALRRWRTKYGAPPKAPPGKGVVFPPFFNRQPWFEAYVDLIAYKRLHGKLPFGVTLGGKS